MYVPYFPQENVIVRTEPGSVSNNATNLPDGIFLANTAIKAQTALEKHYGINAGLGRVSFCSYKFT